MDVKRVARFVTANQADAWVIIAASREILEWFSSQSVAAFAFFGRSAGLPMPAIKPAKPVAYVAATRQLIELGHRRIGFIMGHPDHGSSHDRLAGYRDALKRHHVAFDDELLGRYTLETAGVRALEDRDCYVVRFEPKPGKLAVRKTIDRALNQAEGLLWIDVETFEVARIEFELRQKVSLWWGIMGSVTKMSG